MAGILDLIDPALLKQDAAPLPQPGEFTKGMRAGAYGAGGQLSALAGAAGEALGAQDFANERYAASDRLSQRAQEVGPRVTDVREIKGMRDLGDFALGAIGQSVPAAAAMVGAGALTGGGAIPAMLAGGAVAAPLATGDAIQRQRAAGETVNLGEAGLRGVGQAALESIVPGMVAGKMVGKVAPGVAKRTVGQTVAHNALDIPMEAAASVGGEYVQQVGNGRELDAGAMLNAGAAGAAGGAAFGAAGTAADLARGGAEKAPAAPGATEPSPSLSERAGGAMAKARDLFHGAKGKADEALARVANGQELGDLAEIGAAQGDQLKTMLQRSTDEAGVKVQGWLDELAGATLTDEQKAKLTEAMGDLGDKANQAKVAGVKMAVDAKAASTKAITDLYDHATKKFGDADGNITVDSVKGAAARLAKRATDAKKSEDYSGIHRTIVDTVLPAIIKHHPEVQTDNEALNQMAGAVRLVIAHAAKGGKLDDATLERMRDVFGEDTQGVLQDVFEATGDTKNAAATEKFFSVMNGAATADDLHQQTVQAVTAALPKDHGYSPSDIAALVGNIREHVTGERQRGMGPAKLEAYERAFEASMTKTFGSKAKAVLSAFEAATDDAVEESATAEKADGLSEADTGDAPPVVYGGGKDKTDLVMDPAKHAAVHGNEGQAGDLMALAKQQNPEARVSFKAVRGDMGHVIAEHTKLAGAAAKVTPTDMQAMRLDTDKYPASSSRIDTGVRGMTLDAKGIVRHMRGKNEDGSWRVPYTESDEKGSAYRTARVFMEGLSAIQEHMGKRVVPKDTTVIAKIGGRELTYGDLKRFSFRERDPEWMESVSQDNEGAIKAADAAVAKEFARLKRTVGRADLPQAMLSDAALQTAIAERGALRSRDDKINTAQRRGDNLREMNDRELNLAERTAEALVDKRFAAFKESLGDKYIGPAEFKAMLREDAGINQAKEALNAVVIERKTRDEGDARSRTINDGMETADGLALNKPDMRYHEARLDHLQKMLDAGKGDQGKIRKEIQVTEQHLSDLSKDRATTQPREAGPSSGRTEVGADEQIHTARTVLGEKGIRHRTNMDGTQVRHDGPPIDKMTRMAGEMAASVNAGRRATGRKLQDLMKVVDSMDDEDVLAFSALQTAKRVDAETVAQLHEKYVGEEPDGSTPSPKAPAAKKAALIEKARSGDKALLSEIKASTDAKGLQRAAQALVGERGTQATSEALNARLGELVQDPDVAYSMQRVRATKTISPAVEADVLRYIDKVLGNSVGVAFERIFHAGDFARRHMGDLIRVSVHALSPMSVAYHESLHAFVAQLGDARMHDVTDVLFRSADSASVRAQLRKLLKNEPDALRQIENDREERAAYMYQFWAAGKLTVGQGALSPLGKITAFLRAALGIWSNDQRALHIMEYFQAGEYKRGMSDMSAVHRALMEPGNNAALRKARGFTDALGAMSDSLIGVGHARLRDTGIPALRELADIMKRSTVEEGQDQGFIPSARIERTRMLNDLGERLRGYTEADMREALEAMQNDTRAVRPEARLVQNIVQGSNGRGGVLSEVFDYMREAGVSITKLGAGNAKYFPRVWDTSYIASNTADFRAMLDRYVRNGQYTGNPDDLVRKLVAAEGNEFGIETTKPGMQHAKERLLSFIDAADAAPFLRKDLFEVMNSYITQAARRAEWARRLGDDGKGAQALLDRAVREGATADDIAVADKYLRGVDGTLGDNLNPKARRLMGDMIVYQNIRLLPLAIFSSIVDPMGVMVRGGSVGDAFTVFKRGVKEVSKNFSKAARLTTDADTELAETLGVIDNAMLHDAIGASFSQGMVGDTGRKINDAFFRFNLMEQYTRSMRVGATAVAVRFIGRHADGTASTHSKRWMAELGLTKADVRRDAQGDLMVTEADGLTPEQALKMRMAINKWVDGAVLRPDAADKPIWMNDPHFALISHLKQFMFSFNETILKRVMHEQANGNYAPAMALASYVPIMIAADAVKGLVQGGGEQPEWKQDWDAGDYVWSGVQRAGLLGVGQFGADIVGDAQRGGSGIGALAGPTIDQLTDGLQTLGGREQFGDFALKSLPANALYSEAVSGGRAE